MTFAKDSEIDRVNEGIGRLRLERTREDLAEDGAARLRIA